MIGMNVVFTKVVVYAFSAAMAGVGGAFYVVARQSADVRLFVLPGSSKTQRISVQLVSFVQSKPGNWTTTFVLDLNTYTSRGRR